ncbi:MAG: glycosyltransferase family 39 protein [Gemmatimonadaceae bacterium]
MRLPAFVAGMLIVLAVYLLARRFTDRSTSLLAMALAAVWPALVLYSTNARGYSIIVLAFLVLLMLGDAAIERDSWWPWLIIAVVTALGMYTVPVMLYPAGAAMLWTLAEAARRGGTGAAHSLVPRMAAAVALAAVLTVMANLPVVVHAGLAALVTNKYVTPLSPAQFVDALPLFASDLLATNALGLPRLLLAALVPLAVAGVVAPAPAQIRRRSLAVVTLLWSAALIIVMRRPPPGRVLLFVVPLACMYVASGTRVVLALLARARDQRLAMNVLACAVVISLAAHTALARTVFRAPETGTLVDAPQIADYLLANLRPGDRIAVQAPSGPSLDYYLVRKGGRPMTQDRSAGLGRVFVVVNPRHLQSLASVQRFRRDLPWAELVPEGAPVSFASESIFVFQNVSDNRVAGSRSDLFPSRPSGAVGPFDALSRSASGAAAGSHRTAGLAVEASPQQEVK